MKDQENNYCNVDVNVDTSTLSIPTLQRCIDIRLLNIDTNFYYLPTGGLHFNTNKNLYNKHLVISAPQSHEIKAKMFELLNALKSKGFSYKYAEDELHLGVDIFNADKTMAFGNFMFFSNNVANDYSDFIYEIYTFIQNNNLL